MLTGRDTARLPAIGARPAEVWVFLVGDRRIGLLPVLPGEDGSGFTIYFRSWEAAQLAVLRLRS